MTTQADTLVLKNQKLVHHVLKKFWIKKGDYDEHAAAGMMGLVEASRRFVPPEGADEDAQARAFASYAYWHIFRRVVEVLSNARTVKLNSTRAGRYLSIYFTKITARIQARGDEVTAETVAAEANLPASVVEELLPLFAATRSQNALSVREPANEMDRMTIDVADDAPLAEERLARKERIGRIRKVLSEVEAELDPMEKMLLREQLLKDDGMSMREIGAAFKVTKQRASQKGVALRARLRKRFEAEDIRL